MRNVKRFNLPKGVEMVTVGELFDKYEDGESWEFYLAIAGRDTSSTFTWATPYVTTAPDPLRKHKNNLYAMLGHVPSGLLIPARRLTEDSNADR